MLVALATEYERRLSQRPATRACDRKRRVNGRPRISVALRRADAGVQDHVLQVGRERPDGAVDRHQAVLADVVVLGERRGPVLDRGEARVHLLEELLQVLRARVLRPLDARPMVLVMLDADALVLRRPELGPRLP